MSVVAGVAIVPDMSTQLLLAERFITAHEVANVLRHYESLTGMEFWYD